MVDGRGEGSARETAWHRTIARLRQDYLGGREGLSDGLETLPSLCELRLRILWCLVAVSLHTCHRQWTGVQKPASAVM